MADPAQVVALAEAQHFIFVTQVYFCCMYAVVVWDWVISLPREYKFIWKSNWSAAKCSYLLCRYWVLLVVPYVLSVFVADHSWETCLKLYRSPVALAMWNQAWAEVVLLIRTYAFFNRNKYLLVALCMALVGVLSYQLYVDINQMLPLPFVTPPFDKGPCFPQSKPHSAHIMGYFMASLAFDAIVTSMTLWKAFMLRRSCGATNSPLIQTFLREGILYFVFISIANLINGIFYLQPKQVMSAINIPLSIMLSDVLACRMILDLRERGYEISQPTIIGPVLPLRVDDFERSRATSTFCSNPSSPMKTPISPASGGLPFSSSRSSRFSGVGAKGRGVKGLIGQEQSTQSNALTTTIGSALFSQTQTDSSEHVHGLGLGTRTREYADENGSLELRNFAPRFGESEEDRDRDDEKPDSETLGLASYSVVDIAPQDTFQGRDRGVRANVEKTNSTI